MLRTIIVLSKSVFSERAANTRAGESDAKFTDKGWFWHEGEKPLSVERLFQMYLETVVEAETELENQEDENVQE